MTSAPHCAAWITGEVGKMLKSIARALLTSIMGFAWGTIKVGEDVVAFAESWEVHEGNEQSAGVGELSVWRSGNAIVRMGERLELWVNGLAVRFGYNDGEVSGMVAGSLALAC
jgi:hypothetical protein